MTSHDGHDQFCDRCHDLSHVIACHGQNVSQINYLRYLAKDIRTINFVPTN